ncbi:hypothetical protein FGW37_02485 [Streptomyces rectiverticillatus]|uniref:hypothetical protein n=1 Tax=Streptomyces rectiverticillatus TaxID=173860 RepID=UPI0015C3D6B8|nr:hypothetical protein [Streptomyces rectiverticillatus]QLE70624.1 hypothetical protein FGW37_02485 [Streptomyces rectiverticillatus]
MTPKTSTSARSLDDFLTASAALTGFDAFELHGTGMAELYHETAREQVGEPALSRFLDALAAAGGDPDAIADETSRDIARALAHTWYLGVWPQLAGSVHAALGRERANTAFTVSPEAHTEGLVWRTFHGHPAGAKPPGFGTWADPPPGAPPVARAGDRFAGVPGPRGGGA